MEDLRSIILFKPKIEYKLFFKIVSDSILLNLISRPTHQIIPLEWNLSWQKQQLGLVAAFFTVLFDFFFFLKLQII